MTSTVKYFKMGRIYAKSPEEAVEKLGEGVMSLKICMAQVRADRIWYEYVMEVERKEDTTDGTTNTTGSTTAANTTPGV